LASQNVQVDILQNRVAVVTEAQVAELDFADQAGDGIGRNLAVVDVGLGFKDGHQPSLRCQAPLDDVGHPTERNDGPDQIGEIQVEGYKSSDRDGSLYNVPS